MKKRYLEDVIQEDLRKKMVFVGGPRQVGKTTLAKLIKKNFKNPVYLNWDSLGDKNRILDEKWSPDTDLIIFDEIHKYRKWKSFIKGIWDTRPGNLSIIVTGSSKLDVFRRGGDSLMGRYHYYRLHPFTLNEFYGNIKRIPFTEKPLKLSFTDKSDKLEKLYQYGGFPEPVLEANRRNLKRWQKERLERIFREDIRSVENIRELSLLELLAELIPQRVASPLSINSLQEDCQVSHKTIQSWLNLLARNYYIFKVPPYSKRLERALRKESKYYLWDWSAIKDEGDKFENLVASHLLKYCHYFHDVHGIALDLWYIRDREKREVDFLITWDKKPWLMIEAKLSFKKGSCGHLKYFSERLKVVNSFLVVNDNDVDFIDKKSNVRIISASKFLTAFV